MSDPIKETLAKMHVEFAEKLLEKLRSGECTASELNVIRQFLRDNNIDATREGNPAAAMLAGEFPTFADDPE